ncbi:unannotated protein [freshwater metagenome]|uniref:Unannotated protein n=1 Tax=freshwater metagenome TaxID=449393 RepID=A0A6J6BV37_9ZZZZ
MPSAAGAVNENTPLVMVASPAAGASTILRDSGTNGVFPGVMIGGLPPRRSTVATPPAVAVSGMISGVKVGASGSFTEVFAIRFDPVGAQVMFSTTGIPAASNSVVKLTEPTR